MAYGTSKHNAYQFLSGQKRSEQNTEIVDTMLAHSLLNLQSRSISPWPLGLDVALRRTPSRK